MKKKTKRIISLKEHGSPYYLNDKDTMDDWFERYKADSAGSIEMNGKTYYRVISKWALMSDDEQFVLCNVDYRLFASGCKKFRDENGNVFNCLTKVHYKFSGSIPDWYFEAPEYEFSGEAEVMGEYLTAVE